MDEKYCELRHKEITDCLDEHEDRIKDLEKFRTDTGILLTSMSKDMEFTKSNTNDIKAQLINVQNTVTGETIKKKADAWEKAIWIVIGAVIMFALKKMGAA